MRNKVQKIFIIVTAFLLLPFFANAAPSITSTPASVMHGQSISISGSGFGTKLPVSPYHWQRFDSNPVDTDIETVGYVDGNAPIDSTVPQFPARQFPICPAPATTAPYPAQLRRWEN